MHTTIGNSRETKPANCNDTLKRNTAKVEIPCVELVRKRGREHGVSSKESIYFTEYDSNGQNTDLKKNAKPSLMNSIYVVSLQVGKLK